MVRWIAMLAAGTALAGCMTSPPPEAATPIAPAAAAEVPAALPAPRPELGSFGFDATGMDSTVLPGNNFYQYANGVWAKNTAIPADKSNYGMFTRLDDLSKERTRVIIEDAAKDSNNKIGLAYNAFLDSAAIEANLRQRLITDPHSPSEQRVSVVRNLDPWYSAYDVKTGQTLYLAPEQRVRMW